jgi:tetratricopeptide (TPR) repeat protein
MSDPLRTDAVRPADSLVDAGREARIEQLLLAGLDEYFAGQYEQAINIWTRVVFLERGHNRARAYIERARGALAERHRESDELLHRGIAAFNNGETDAARDLITKAVEQGGAHDVALVLLERLNRLATPAAPAEARPASHTVVRIQLPRAGHAPARHTWWLWAAAAVAIVSGAFAVAVMTGLVLPDALADPSAASGERIAAMRLDPLPVARSAERLLAQARAYESAGQLHDALRVLDAVGLADPLRPEADRLRGDLQRRLLGAAFTETTR